MNILGLDLSTKKTGWGYFVDGKLEDYGVISCDHQDVTANTLTIREEISKLMQSKKIHRVVIEDLTVGFGRGTGNFHTVVVLAVLRGCVLGLCVDYNIEYVLYEPSVWRMFAKVQRKVVECVECGWIDEIPSEDNIASCPICGNSTPKKFRRKALNKRVDLKRAAVIAVNERYGLNLKFYAKDTKAKVSDDDIAEAILMAEAHMFELNL